MPEAAPFATPFAMSAPGEEAAAASPAPGRLLPVLPVARRRSDEAEAPASAALPDEALPAAAGSASDTARTYHVAPPSVLASGAVSPTLPTLGFRPLRPGLTAQRDAAAAMPAAAEVVVPARRAPGDGLPATVRGVTPGQAETASIAGSWPPSSAPSSAADSPTGASWSQRRGTLSLAQSQTAARVATPAAVDAPLVSRIVAGPASPAAQPVVQASPASAGGSSPGGSSPGGSSAGGSSAGGSSAGFTATPVVQRVDGAAPAAPAPQGRSETELDELARDLFGRIRTHLRSEVIHEREAKGLSFDAF
ncbi:MAG: hypothetical protein MUQ32_06475 [Chloroflexi bacterium]|nr:hypothetical protein [Chloroflexota bacterium]